MVMGRIDPSHNTAQIPVGTFSWPTAQIPVGTFSRTTAKISVGTFTRNTAQIPATRKSDAGRPAGACHHLPETPRLLAISEASPNRYVVNTLGCLMYLRRSPVATEMTLTSCRRAGHRIHNIV